jgi:hypothetical protein
VQKYAVSRPTTLARSILSIDRPGTFRGSELEGVAGVRIDETVVEILIAERRAELRCREGIGDGAGEGRIATTGREWGGASISRSGDDVRRFASAGATGGAAPRGFRSNRPAACGRIATGPVVSMPARLRPPAAGGGWVTWPWPELP